AQRPRSTAVRRRASHAGRLPLARDAAAPDLPPAAHRRPRLREGRARRRAGAPLGPGAQDRRGGALPARAVTDEPMIDPMAEPEGRRGGARGRAAARWRRSSTVVAAWAVVVAAVTTSCAPRPSPAGPWRSVLLVTVDTLRADRLGAYGHDRATSPAIDALAAR